MVGGGTVVGGAGSSGTSGGGACVCVRSVVAVSVVEDVVVDVGAGMYVSAYWPRSNGRQMG